MRKISVIIPVYNAEKYIRQCLDSVIKQTFANLEIICVNDGSQDNSDKILAEYAAADSRIKILTQDNQGLSAARNAGIKIAGGDYIGFVDSDDYVDLDFYEKLLAVAEKNNADIVMGATRRFGDNFATRIYPPYKNMVSNKLSEKLAFLRGGGVWDKIYKASIIKEHRIDFQVGHNYEGNLFLLKAVYFSKTMATTVDTFYNYFYNESGICFNRDVQKTRQRMIDRMAVMDSICQFIKEYKFCRNGITETKKLILHSVLDDKETKRKYLWYILRLLGPMVIVKNILAHKLRKAAGRYGRKYY
jgi:glycosyltransferase involved in cell wall biosynthesis